MPVKFKDIIAYDAATDMRREDALVQFKHTQVSLRKQESRNESGKSRKWHGHVPLLKVRDPAAPCQ